MAELCLLDENGAIAQRWEIGNHPVAVGRDGSADVLIPDDTLSRRHFLIWQQGESFLIKDLGSQNGTWVDGHAQDGRASVSTDAEPSSIGAYLTFDTGKIPANMTQSLGPIDTGIPVLYARDQGVDYRTAMQISPQDADASDDVLVNVGGLKAFFAGSQLYSITAKILTLNGFPSVDKNDGRWIVRSVPGAAASKPYRCPGCRYGRGYPRSCHHCC